MNAAGGGHAKSASGVGNTSELVSNKTKGAGGPEEAPRGDSHHLLHPRREGYHGTSNIKSSMLIVFLFVFSGLGYTHTDRKHT